MFRGFQRKWYGRSYRRIEVDERYPVKVRFSVFGQDFQVDATDISPGGLRFPLPDSLRRREEHLPLKVSISLPVPKIYQFSTVATVRHTHDGSFGVAFESIQARDKRRVWAYYFYIRMMGRGSSGGFSPPPQAL